MANKGADFLRLSRAHTLLISTHALARIFQNTSEYLSTKEAGDIFDAARQLNHQEVVELGYRPNYLGRQQRGVQTWYFLFFLRGKELIAVVQNADDFEEFIWVTTYARNSMADMFSIHVPNDKQVA